MKTHIDFTTDYILENANVLLRPIRLSDLTNLMKFSMEEPDLWKYSLLTAAGAENLEKYILAAEKARACQKEYAFIVFDKKRNEYGGSTRFYDIQPNHGTVQLGYTWYGKDFQGTGLNKNCKYLLLELAFEKWNLERVEFRADNNNERSIAAMKSIGCSVEGILRSHMLNRDGGRRDSIVLSILRSEWNNGIKEVLRNKLKLPAKK
ncbi:MAG: GNAT family N-acetyltransferase [Bacteroidota bacterium]|nr:GNAT family N-acetyltransferase [Bacteroidota bacterium]